MLGAVQMHITHNMRIYCYSLTGTVTHILVTKEEFKLHIEEFCVKAAVDTRQLDLDLVSGFKHAQHLGCSSLRFPIQALL